MKNLKTIFYLFIFLFVVLSINLCVFANESGDNTNLKIMRLNEVGITPSFSKDIKKYYITVSTNVNSLELTALPEEEGAKVNVYGNTNLKNGLNEVTIKVTSRDGSKTSEYKIYVTRTDETERSNANLENLAIREAILYPTFEKEVTEYKIEIKGGINKLDILAVPENTNAKVQILGNEELKVGDNNININVLAEDGITTKEYVIVAHKMNEEEQIEAEEKENIEERVLVEILENEEKEEKGIKENNRLSNNVSKENKNSIIFTIVLILISLSAIIFYIIKHKKQ